MVLCCIYIYRTPIPPFLVGLQIYLLVLGSKVSFPVVTQPLPLTATSLDTITAITHDLIHLRTIRLITYNTRVDSRKK